MSRRRGGIARQRGSARFGRHELRAYATSLSPFVDQIGNQPGPAGLVRGAEAFAGVAVEVFVEEDEVLPMRVVREELGLARSARAVERAIAIRVRQEDVDHPVGQV